MLERMDHEDAERGRDALGWADADALLPGPADPDASLAEESWRRSTAVADAGGVLPSAVEPYAHAAHAMDRQAAVAPRQPDRRVAVGLRAGALSVLGRARARGRRRGSRAPRSQNLCDSGKYAAPWASFCGGSTGV